MPSTHVLQTLSDSLGVGGISRNCSGHLGAADGLLLGGIALLCAKAGLDHLGAAGAAHAHPLVGGFLACGSVGGKQNYHLHDDGDQTRE